MAGINFIGSYSGIDQATIDKLMEVEKLPLIQLSNKKIDITSKQNAWKDVNTRLNSLFEKLKVLQSPETFNSRTTKSSDDSFVSVTASKDAVDGKYDISVGKLATSTRVIGGKLDSVYDENGKFIALGMNGSFTIENNDYVEGEEDNIAEIVINENDTLKDVVNRINDKSKDTGINATIIDGMMVLTDEKTGARGITLSDDGNDILSNLGFNTETYINGTKAEFSINGIDITSDSNTITDVVLGLTINLNQKGDSTVTVATDTEKLTEAIQDFVDQYNSTMGFIEEQLAAGTVSSARNENGLYETVGRGALAGDSSLQNLHSSLRRMVTETLGGNKGTTINDISILGVTTKDKSGVLSFDSSKLLDEFSKDPQNVMNFFSNKIGDEDVGFIAKLNSKIDSYITSDKGIIKGKTEGFEKTLKDLNKQIDNFNDRMIRKEEYYTKKFAALDVAMMQAESQMAWLESQISAMNAQTAANKK
jgi:flagellar hook-associated protein 2